MIGQKHIKTTKRTPTKATKATKTVKTRTDKLIKQTTPFTSQHRHQSNPSHDTSADGGRFIPNFRIETHHD
jgi:hypothetical protein